MTEFSIKYGNRHKEIQRHKRSLLQLRPTFKPSAWEIFSFTPQIYLLFFIRKPALVRDGRYSRIKTTRKQGERGGGGGHMIYCKLFRWTRSCSSSCVYVYVSNLTNYQNSHDASGWGLKPSKKWRERKREWEKERKKEREREIEREREREGHEVKVGQQTWCHHRVTLLFL